jgi:hypothetical protein
MHICIETASKQPLFKARWIVQILGLFLYFQLKDLVANLYVDIHTKSQRLIPYHLREHNGQS